MEIFNEAEWTEKIKNPTWYMGVSSEMEKLQELRDKDKEKFETEKERIYSFFEAKLDDGEIALGNLEGNFDVERKPIDTVVIHHTHGRRGMTKERLSAMELVRLYAPYYENPTYENDKSIKGEPISSGHIREGKQVFYPYHWIVREDGSVERLLNDSEVGWHSGNWEVNCRSVAIAFDHDFEDSTPSDVELMSVVKIIRENYPTISKDKIVGHCEVNSKTTCPSNLFLSKDGQQGWKDRLLGMI